MYFHTASAISYKQKTGANTLPCIQVELSGDWDVIYDVDVILPWEAEDYTTFKCICSPFTLSLQICKYTNILVYQVHVVLDGATVGRQEEEVASHSDS